MYNWQPASPTPTLEVIDEQSTRIKVDDDDQVWEAVKNFPGTNFSSNEC